MKELQLLFDSLVAKLEPAFEQALAHQYTWWLLEAATGLSKTALLIQQDILLSFEMEMQLEEWINQLVHDHMPIAYVLGYVVFAECTIAIHPPILIPRPETEAWCLELIEHIKKTTDKPLRILDLCTGSGCIAIALAHALPNAHITAVDISPDALLLARQNAQRNNIGTISFIQSDLFEKLSVDQPFDIIVANPPYISQEEWKTLDLSVKNWEDPNALIAPQEGFGLIERIINTAPQFLRDSTMLYPRVVIEIGYNQGRHTLQLMQHAGYNRSELKKDYSNHDRVVWGSITNASTNKKT